MYPSTLIRLNKRNIISLELKNGSRVSGYLNGCDVAMNLHMTNVTITPPTDNITLLGNNKLYTTKGTTSAVDIKETYIKGTSIKMVKLHTWVLTKQGLFDSRQRE